MNAQDNSIIKGVESHLVKWLLGIATTTIITAIGFYYSTNTTLAQNTDSIRELKIEVKEIVDVPRLNELKINQVNVKLYDLEKGLETSRKERRDDNIRMNEKLDRILERLPK